MELSRIRPRGQTTIPKRIREAANLREGDVVAFEVQGEHLVLTKVTRDSDGYRTGLSEVMHEWSEPEDEAAWRDL